MYFRLSIIFIVIITFVSHFGLLVVYSAPSKTAKTQLLTFSKSDAVHSLKKSYLIINDDENSWTTSVVTAAKKEEEARIAKEEEEKKQQQAQQAIAVVAQTSITLNTAAVSGDYISMISARCTQVGCDTNQLVRVMYCESGGRSNAVGGGYYIGLFQFNPSTFAANARNLGLANADIWNPEHQIYVATYMFAHGQAGQWSCK